jgi:putative hydrolase of the HAD superfamily
MADVRAVIFDLGRVLIGLNLSRGLFGLLASTSEQPGGALLDRLLKDELYVSFSTGKLPPDEFHRRLCERTDLDLSFAEFRQAWCEVFEPIPGMDRLLAEVATRLPVGLLSDTDPIHWADQLARNAWLGSIPNPTLSFETGLLKPHPGCYQAAAASVCQPARHCLFIDDLERNVDGARAAGMQAIRFEGCRALRAQLAGLGILDHRGGQACV